jgi:hypothetical protein
MIVCNFFVTGVWQRPMEADWANAVQAGMATLLVPIRVSLQIMSIVNNVNSSLVKLQYLVSLKIFLMYFGE